MGVSEIEMAGLPVGQLAGVGRPVSWSAGQPVGQSAGRSADRPISRSAGQSAGRPVGLSASRPADRPAGRSVGHSAGWPAGPELWRWLELFQVHLSAVWPFLGCRNTGRVELLCGVVLLSAESKSLALWHPQKMMSVRSAFDLKSSIDEALPSMSLDPQQIGSPEMVIGF